MASKRTSARDPTETSSPMADTVEMNSNDAATAAESISLVKSHTSPDPATIKQPHKGRWLTPEYLVYIAWLAFCYFEGGRLVLKRSETADSQTHRHLQEGWIFGHRVDVADGQYRFFRNEIPILTVAAIGFLALSHAVRFLSNNSLSARLLFYFTFSFGFLIYINGSTVVFILAIVALNYFISFVGTRHGMGRIATISTWMFNCLVLLANERYHGYRWREILLLGNDQGVSASVLSEWAYWLDANRGLFPWHGLFNLVVLRMISFNLDRIWASENRPILERDGSILTFLKHSAKCKEGCELRGKEGPCPWWREKVHHSLSEYSPLPYFVYLFYIPLHFAGPTMTFNSFLSHIKLPQQTYSTFGLIKYLVVKVLFIFLVLEIWLHYFYVFSFTNTSTFLSLTPYEMSMVSYFTLVAIWLKFTAIWRFFRCWALFDGVEPPENMQRCVSNNYSIQSFWRAWHRSFNRWLVRYIYVPLGGGGGGGSVGSLPAPPTSKVWSVLRQSFNVFLTFSFVAFWHDRTMQLLAWGWLIALLFIPELSARTFFNLRSIRSIKQRWYWRHICGVGAAINIFMMMVANLIGYSVGISGTSSILHTIITEGGVMMFVVIFTAFFSAAMIMFEFRETGITVD